MKTSLRLITLIATILALGATTLDAFAQTSGTNVVVLDVGKVFKEHVRFKQAMEVMKKDVEAFENVIRNGRASIQQKAEELQTFNPGSPEYKAREAEIAKITSELQVDTQLKRKEFMEREAKLYYNTYTEITKAVAAFADRHGIALVLRYNSDEIQPDDRNSVLQGVNNNVVFQRNRDVTKAIIDEVNRGVITTDLRNQNQPQIPRRTN